MRGEGHRLLLVGAVLGFLAVALGAFGAHALEAFLVQAGRVATWETAVFYHLVHAVAIFAAAGRFPLAGWLWAGGAVVFSGSLYTLCLTGVTWLGAVTPLGGILLLAGWVALGVSAWQRPRG